MHAHAFCEEVSITWGGEYMAYIHNWLADLRRIKEISETLEKELTARSSLTLNGYYVLYFLAHSEEKKLRLNLLQEQMGLSQSAMSRMIARMEGTNCGSIQRVSCECDKRGVYIAITECGLKRLAEAEPVVEDVLQRFYA